MDRSRIPTLNRSPPVPSPHPPPLDLLLPAAAGGPGESAPAPTTRRTVYGAPVLWQPSHGRNPGGEPKADPAIDAHSGHRVHLPETQSQPPGAGSRDLPLPAARSRD